MTSPYSTHHIPILLDPITDFLSEGLKNLPASAPPGVILDCTLGGGGHSARLLEKIDDLTGAMKHCILGIDRDPEAISRAQLRFSSQIAAKKMEVIHSSFSDALKFVHGRPIYGVLADLGISSDQIDSQTRGFSFRYPAPLDMRMNTETGMPLSELLADASETELSDILWKYGEERLSRKIARRLVDLRSRGQLPKNSQELAEAISMVFPPPLRYKRMHPATQSFQALRIAVNEELKELEILIAKILPAVTPGGRIAILSFHSLEDRMVKEALRNKEVYDLPQRKAIQASNEEVESNSRSRSAKLRFAVKI